MNVVVVNPFTIFGGASPHDPDALAWFALVEAAGFSINATNKAAFSAFVVQCKADASPNSGVSNFTAMEEPTFLCGVSGIDGARIPLKGSIGTKFFFTDAHYNITGGATSDGSTTYLRTNRTANADPQNNQSFGLYIANIGAGTELSDRFMGTDTGGNASELVNGPATNGVDIRARHNNSTLATGTNAAGSGIVGASRHQSSDFVLHAFGSETTHAIVSAAPKTTNFGVFAAQSGSNKCPITVPFFWAGKAVTMSLLNTRVATLLSSLVA